MKAQRLIRALGPNGALRIHFGQWGEDVIVRKTFRKTAKRNSGFYMDVGAYHPFRQSNTAHLWCLGWNGVNVDANRRTIDVFNKVRRGDVNVWSAVVSDEVAASNETVSYYSQRNLDLEATILPEMAEERGRHKVEQVPCVSLRMLIDTYGPKAEDGIDFLNIDIEGLDEDAVASVDQWSTLPRVIAIETYARTIPDVLETGIHRHLTAAGYDYRHQIGLTSIYVHQSATELA